MARAINNTARISDNNNGAPVTASAVTTVTSDHQLALSKSAPSIVAAGQLLTYTLDYNVTGNAPAPTVVLTDVGPGQHDLRVVHGRLHAGRQASSPGTWAISFRAIPAR